MPAHPFVDDSAAVDEEEDDDDSEEEDVDEEQEAVASRLNDEGTCVCRRCTRITDLRVPPRSKATTMTTSTRTKNLLVSEKNSQNDLWKTSPGRDGAL